MRRTWTVVVAMLLACGANTSTQGTGGTVTGTSAPTPSAPPGTGGSGQGTGGGVFVGGDTGSGTAQGGTGSSGAASGATTPPANGSVLPASGSGGGKTLWAHKMGGLGIEYTHDVAVAPDGSIVAFNLIGVRGESLEQIGFVHMDADGNELQSEFENESGPALHLARAGSFTVGSTGALVVAAAGRCSSGTCPTVGGKPIDGGAVVSLTPRAQASWEARGGGDVVSNVDADGQGDVLVAEQAKGGVVRVYRPDGSTAWERTGIDTTAPVAVSFDAAGGALAGTGATVIRIDGTGAQSWQRSLGSDVTVTAIRATASGAIVHGRYRGALDAAGTTLHPPAGADHGWFLLQLGSDGAPQWGIDLGVVQETADDIGSAKTLLAVRPDGTIVVVTGADACTAAVATFDASGGRRWRRPVAVNGCGGHDLVVHGLAIAPSNRILVGGALSAPIDFGTGTLDALATDAFVVALAP